jgi:F-type H+-transporting ATPase subunit a
LDIVHEFKLVNFTDWGPFSLNKAIIWMFIAAFLSCLVIYAAGKKSLRPGRYQGAMEVILSLIREKMVLDTMGEDGLPFFPLIASLFFFVFFCNIVGIIPLSHYGFTATSNYNVTGALMSIVFCVVLVVGIRKKGVLGYLKSFAPSGVPKLLLPLIFVVEMVSLFAKHFALMVRLFANMLAGHIVILVFVSGAVALFWSGIFHTILSVFPFAGVVGMLFFEIFVAFIQAFIFAILASLYIGDSLREHH